jgi:cysteine-rich repeat protein
MKKHLVIALWALLILWFAFKDTVVVSSHPCAQNISVYDTCRDEWLSEKLCVIRSSSQVDVAKSCLEQTNTKIASVNSYAQLSSYFSEPLVTTAPVYEDRVTVMLSPTDTERKTIIHDFDDSYSKDWYQAMLQIVSDLEWNDTKLFGLLQSPSYEKEVAEYMIDAIDAYEVEAIDNWSSYFASIDSTVNPNIFDVVIKNWDDLALFVAEMKAKKGVEIFPVYIPQLYAVPNDPQSNVWHLKWWNGVNAYEARDQLSWTSLSSVQVGIVDDGFYVSHEDLSIASAVPAWAWGGHGTHVAWLVGALTNNGKWVPSAARNTWNIVIKWYNYRFWQWDNDGSSNIMWLVSQAVQDGAKVINMSWWWGWFSSADQQIFSSAYNQWVVLIAAAGNESASQPWYPAKYAGVISVGATTSAWSLASFSNRWADILSPGSSIQSTCIGWWYCNHSGTSMASPLAASVAALLLSIKPSLSPDQIENILKTTKNAQWVINACNAVAAVLQNWYKCTWSSSGTTNWWTSSWSSWWSSGWSNSGWSSGGWAVNGVCDDVPMWIEELEYAVLPENTVNAVGVQVQEWVTLSNPSDWELELWSETRQLQNSIAQPIQEWWTLQESSPRPRFLTMSVLEENEGWSVIYSMITETPRDEVSLDLLMCNNNKKDGDETDVDCGGSCKKCLYGNECLVPTDCSTNYCVNYAWWAIGTGSSWTGNNGWMSWLNETVRFEVTVSPNVVYPSQYANVVIKALNKMHQVNMQATNAYKVRLEWIVSWTVALPSAGTFSLWDYGVKFYEPWFAASQRWAYTLVVEDVTNPTIRGSMPITVLGWGNWGTPPGGTPPGGTPPGGTPPGWCTSDAECKSTEYCKKSLSSNSKHFESQEDVIVLPEKEKITIGEDVVFVKYKNNQTPYFQNYSSNVLSQESYNMALLDKQVSTIQSVRGKDLSPDSYAWVQHVRALYMMQQAFEKYTISSLSRPLEGYVDVYDLGTNLYQIKTTPEQVDAIVAQLKTDSSVEYVEAGKIDVYPYEIQINDPKITDQWHVRWKSKNAWWINVVEARNIAEGAERNWWPIYVIVADEWVDPGHEDLKNKLEWNSYAWEHGTHVWWLIAAEANNGKWVIGVAWNEKNVKLIRVWLCDITSAATALSWKKWVVNLSCGMSGMPQSYKNAADAIVAKWNVLIAAAWNGWADSSYIPSHWYADANKNPPCNYDKSINCIWATSISNAVASFSSHWSVVDISAPWLQIMSTYIGNKYEKMSWTSMASPVAAWAVAFLMSLGATWPQAVQLLKDTAVSFNTQGRALGVWRIDLCNATAKYLNKPPCTNSFVPSPWSGGANTTAWTPTAWSNTAWWTTSGGTGKWQCVPKDSTWWWDQWWWDQWWWDQWWWDQWWWDQWWWDQWWWDQWWWDNWWWDQWGGYDQCTDGIKNGYETDVDCGWSYCPKCAKWKMCGIWVDCVTNYCNTWNGSGSNNGTWTYECPVLSGVTLWTKNITFSDSTNLASIFWTTKQYVVVGVSDERCGPCLNKAATLNQDTALQKRVWPDSICWFVTIVPAQNLAIWKNKSQVQWFVANNSKWYSSSASNIMQSMWLSNLGIPRMALLKRDGTYLNDDIQLSEIAQYCMMCPFKQNPPVWTWEVCGDTVDKNADGFTGLFYAAVDYNNDKKLTVGDLTEHRKVELNLQSPLSGKIYDINNDTFINTWDRNIIQNYILWVQVGIEICSDWIDNDCNGKIDAADTKCDSSPEPPEGLSLCQKLKIFDCDGNGTFNSGDVASLQKSILWIIPTFPALPVCDMNWSSTHSTLDLVLMQRILLWLPDADQWLVLFDYDGNGKFETADKTRLQTIILNSESCPSWKACDVNMSNSVTVADVLLLTQLQDVASVAQQCGAGMSTWNNSATWTTAKIWCDTDKDTFLATSSVPTNNTSWTPYAIIQPNWLYQYCASTCLTDITCQPSTGDDCNDTNSSIKNPWSICMTAQWTWTMSPQCVCIVNTPPPTWPATVWCDADKDSFFDKKSVPTNTTAWYPYATLQSDWFYQYCATNGCLPNVTCKTVVGDDCDDLNTSIKNPWSVCTTNQWTWVMSAQCVCSLPTPNVELCDDSIDNDGDWKISCADPDCTASSSCQLTIQPNCSAVTVFDCNGNGTFTYDDIEALRKKILWITTTPDLPICDPNWSNSHSTMDLVLLQAIVNGNANVNSLALFDYNSDGAVNSTDLIMLWQIFYGQTTCPSGKVCDLNNWWWTNIIDLNVLNRIINNSLTSCDVGCGNASIEWTEWCDDGNLTNGDGCSSLCQFEQVQTPENPQNPQNPEWSPIASLFQSMIASVRSYFTSSSHKMTQLYARLFWESVGEDNQSVFETASLKTSRMMCGNNICETEKNESPWSCIEDCGCGNGLINPRREQCDDGNRVSGDGCSDSCKKELRGKMCAYFPGTEPPANLIWNDGAIVTPVRPVPGDPQDPDKWNDKCLTWLLYCLEWVCGNYKDIQAWCYKKCCEAFSYCADAVKMCSYRGPGWWTWGNSWWNWSNSGWVIWDGWRWRWTWSNWPLTGDFIIWLPMWR